MLAHPFPEMLPGSGRKFSGKNFVFSIFLTLHRSRRDRPGISKGPHWDRISFPRTDFERERETWVLEFFPRRPRLELIILILNGVRAFSGKAWLARGNSAQA